MNSIKKQGLEMEPSRKQEKIVFLTEQNLELHLNDFFQFGKKPKCFFSILELKDKKHFYF